MSGCADNTSHCRGIATDNRGFSLVELIVVMGIFLTVMLITSSAFKLIANNSSQQSKSLETQIGGIVGLEVLRADLEQAGFGLPWTFQTPPSVTSYLEAASTTYNDATANAPRAIVSGFNNGLFGSYTGSKYIVIKSTVAATNESAKKWTNVSYVGGSRATKIWGDSHRDFAANDKVIVVKNNLNTTPTSRQLMVSSGTFFTTFGNFTTLTQPHLDGDTFQVYGIAPAATASLRMPFNRADYYLSADPATDVPVYCAPNTGVLYKATINHSDGLRNKIPLLDCVADLQIVYGLDSSLAGVVNIHGTDISSLSADDIRKQLREIRVYILAQDGKKDVTFNYPTQTVDVGESFDGGATLAGRRFDLQAVVGSSYRNYRWKLYSIVVRPKNLIQ